ncbi:MAG: YbhB/YbcL family Raf kinase inhibitor-like protein, partial [candidate division Zixibacteria bacterium]|nr:YbhB/YbcL family Raf kinase inhibitor-like protein [candidate division Zixibacteria bacterium]
MLPKSCWFAVLVLMFALSPAHAQTNAVAVAPQPAAFKVTSSAFQEGGRIPVPYTCNGLNISPPLAWAGAPAGTESFAIICDDLDANYKTFSHWVIFNIPKTAT